MQPTFVIIIEYDDDDKAAEDETQAS